MHYVTGDNEAGHASTTVYGGAMARQSIPRYEMNEEELDPRAAKRFIADELQLDGTPALNLASFVTTYMEPEAEELMRDNLNKNFIDVEEYPSLGDIESRCVNIVAKLFNAPTSGEHNALGVSTVGSSEAIILAVLAAKRRWQKARRDAGKDTSKPNLVMNAAVQVCWEKAARYLEVEERYWFTKPGQYAADPKELIDLVDENTILVCAILGTTYTGEYEDVQEINRLLEEKNKKDDLNVHIHVDAASGGFVAPFVVPDLVWDFRNSLVCSINTSGHKYQLTYAGIGYLVLRDKSFLPDEIVFTVNYLGSPQISFTLNFSKSGVQLIASYYQMLRLGKSGYRAIMYTLTETADYLSKFVEEYDGGKKFKIISQTGGKGLPLVAWSIKPESNTKWDEFALARGLRQKGWIVPAYTMAPHSEKLKLMRVVIREDFSRSRAEAFIRDLTAAIKTLDETPTPVLDHDKQKNGPKESDDEKKPNHKHAVHHEKHSLRGKYGKTHAVC